MKRIVHWIFITILLCVFAVPVTSFAEEMTAQESEISGQVDELFEEHEVGFSYEDIVGLSFSEVANLLRNKIADELSAPLKLLAAILVVVIFTAVTQSAGESFFDRSRSGGMYDLICVTAAAAVITPQLLSVYSGVITAIEQTGSFLLVFVPAFSGITVATGAITTGSFYNMMILAASEVIVKLSESFLTPLLSLMAVFAITGSIFPNASVSGFSELLKKTSTWGLSIAMALFTGFVSMKCTLTSRADGAASKAVKMMISGFVPVVGGAVSDAYTSVRSGLEVIRCTVGVGGNIAIAMMILPPIIKIAAFRIVLWAGTAAADLFSAQPLSKLMKGLDGGLAIAQSVLICYSVMFILCTAILMQSLA